MWKRKKRRRGLIKYINCRKEREGGRKKGKEEKDVQRSEDREEK